MKPAQQDSKHGIFQADFRYLLVIEWLGFHGHMRALISFFLSFFPSFLESLETSAASSPQIMAILLNFCPPQFSFPSGESPLGCNTEHSHNRNLAVIRCGSYHRWRPVAWDKLCAIFDPIFEQISQTSLQNSRELVQNSRSRSVFSIPAIPPYPKQWKGSLHVFLRYPASFAPSLDCFVPVCFWIEYLLNQRLR